MKRTHSGARCSATVALLVGVLLLGACSSTGSDQKADSGGSSGSVANGETSTSGGDGASSTSTTAGSQSSGDENAAPVGKVATGRAVPSKGCGTPDAAKAVSLEKLMVGDRYYLLTVPSTAKADTPLPLVLDFHGLLEGAEVHAKDSNLSPFAESHDFVLATPNGSGNPVHWEVSPDRKANPDLVFVDALLDQIEAEQCIDTSRVYSTGLSNGAFLSSVLACVMSDRIAAVAPVAGLQHDPGCKPGRPVPVLAFHGTQDPILLFNGGKSGRLGAILAGKEDDTPLPKADLNGDGYPKAAREWAKTNGCKDTFTDKKVTDSVIRRTFADCPPDGAVVFDIVEGGGHTWPGTKFSIPLEKIMGATDQTLDANAEIWAFFQRFRLPQT